MSRTAHPPRADALALALALALGAGFSLPVCAQTESTLPPVVVPGTVGTSLTVPSTQKAKQQIEQTPGGVALVPDTAWRDTQAATIKDILDYTPGVFAQPKWGEDSRLSIRGSGLSRYFHLRGIMLYQDGVPLNQADGSADFQWIDPSAYRYTEVYKGANALRYGAATLGGAVNFVTPSGRDADAAQARVDAGSFGWRRLQGSLGGAGERADGFVTGSWQRQEGFREHSGGESLRVSGNTGWRFAPGAETRFYLTGVRIRQAIPGSVSRADALTNPRRAAPINVTNDWQRNIDGGRLSNRTVLMSGTRTLEFGGWLARSALHHPIFQFLDNDYHDHGLYTRLQTDAPLAGHNNRFTLGLTWAAGKIDANNFVNTGGQRGALLSQTRDESDNLTLYAENAFDLVPGLTLIAGLQHLQARRERADLFNGDAPPTRSGNKRYNLVNPKLGMLWQASAQAQLYANLSRSGEPPTFGDMNFAVANDLDRLRPQRATTFEIGTRGDTGDLSWDVAVYRAQLRNEFQCVSSMFNICDRTVNLDRSIHQGLEAGLQWIALRGLFTRGARADRLQLNAAYTYSDFRFRDDPQWGNNRIPGVPGHYLRAEAVYRHPAGFWAGPNVEWVPRAYFVDSANSVKTASYALLGIRAGWEQGAWSFFIEGRNLTDRRYIASASITDRATDSSTLFEPGTGRALYAGLQLRY